jgi:hypothetical protein
MQAQPTTKEQLVYFLLQNVSLGSYDKKFISNILNLNITQKKAVTTNQDNLLNKVTMRYRRQLSNLSVDATAMIGLPWTRQPIDSLPEYTEAHLLLVDDQVILRSPYHKEFVRKLHETTLGVWNRDLRFWTFEYNERVLRGIIELTESYFNKVNYNAEIVDILHEVENYKDVKYWTPTLVRVNKNLMIAATNESLDEALRDLTLSTDLATLARLTFYGVRVGPELLLELHDDMAKSVGSLGEAWNRLLFALNMAPELDMESTDAILHSIKLIDPDLVILTDYYSNTQKYISDIHKILVDNDISCVCISRDKMKIVDTDKYDTDFIVRLSYGGAISPNHLHLTEHGYRIGKNIRLVDNRTINT